MIEKNVALRAVNLISLCSGGGGLDLGIELAMPTARSVVLVEREAFAVSHLVSAMQQGLMAQAAVWSDVTTFNGRPWRGIVDGLIGGIPCQPHSLAGKRQGEDDERDLWSDARRIIVQSRSWFVLIENVRGMLSAKAGLDPGALRIRRDLQRLGFDVEGGLFTASEVGASHERERLFILAVADSRCKQWGTWRRFAGGTGWTQSQSAGSGFGFSGSGLADADFARSSEHRSEPGNSRSQLAATQRICGHVVDSTGERWGEGLAEPEFRSGRDTAASPDDAMGHAMRSRLHASAYAGIHSGEESRRPRHEDTDGSGEPVGNPVGGGYDRRSLVEIGGEIGRASIEGPGERLGLFPPGPGDLHSWRYTIERAPELEPAFRRVADGLASRLDTARVDRLRMLGNGVVPLQAAYAFRTLATRLAAGGSPGAAWLVHMMEQQ